MCWDCGATWHFILWLQLCHPEEKKMYAVVQGCTFVPLVSGVSAATWVASWQVSPQICCRCRVKQLLFTNSAGEFGIYGVEPKILLRCFGVVIIQSARTCSLGSSSFIFINVVSWLLVGHAIGQAQYILGMPSPGPQEKLFLTICCAYRVYILNSNRSLTFKY